MSVAAIVLAGGRSERFGSDKLRAELDGVPLIQHAVRTALAVANEVIVVGPSTGVPVDLGDLSVQLVYDDLAAAGPLAGTAAGLRAASGDTVLVLAGDAPHVPIPLLRALVAHPDKGSLTLSRDGRLALMPVRLPRAIALAAATQLLEAGERRFGALIEAVNATSLDETWWRLFDPTAAWSHDVDHQRDLRSSNKP